MTIKKRQCPQARIIELEEENAILRKMVGMSTGYLYDEKLCELGEAMVSIYSNMESSFANQGRGIDVASMLATYSTLVEKFKEVQELRK
jgi:hypothetical protein